MTQGAANCQSIPSEYHDTVVQYNHQCHPIEPSVIKLYSKILRLYYSSWTQTQISARLPAIAGAKIEQAILDEHSVQHAFGLFH